MYSTFGHYSLNRNGNKTYSTDKNFIGQWISFTFVQTDRTIA